VIVGGGFGGLYAARALEHVDVQVTVLDRRNHHVFQPLLYQVASAALSPGDIASPIRWILRKQKNVQVLLADVRSIDAPRDVVVTDRGEMSYDFLIVASGAACSKQPQQAAPAQPAASDAAQAQPAEAAPAAAAPATTEESAPTAPTETVTETDDAPAATTDQAASGVQPTLRLAAATNVPASEHFKEGTNYRRVVPAQPTNVAPGKVEVVEFFWYGCGHCFALDPAMETWRAKSKPQYVEFTRVPAMWNDALRMHARLYYTAEALGNFRGRLGAGRGDTVSEFVRVEARHATPTELLEHVALPRRDTAGQRHLQHRRADRFTERADDPALREPCSSAASQWSAVRPRRAPG